MAISRSIPFIILTTLLIPSIICYGFIFVQSIRKGILRKHLSSHVILVVLVCSFLQVNLPTKFHIPFSRNSSFQVITELPILLSYLYNGISPALSDGFCKFWACQDYSFNVMILMLTAHTASERYLLVFHNAFFRQHLLILHCLPIIFCCIYPPLLYMYFIVIYPCTNQFDYTMVTCGGPCYYYEPIVSTFDQFVNLILPVAVSSLVSLIVLIRVIRKKQHMRQQRIWKKNRRLVIQLLYVVISHNVVWLPMVICSTIMYFGAASQEILLYLAINILPIGIYVVILLCPFTSLLSLPKLSVQTEARVVPQLRTNPHASRPAPQSWTTS